MGVLVSFLDSRESRGGSFREFEGDSDSGQARAAVDNSTPPTACTARAAVSSVAEGGGGTYAMSSEGEGERELRECYVGFDWEKRVGRLHEAIKFKPEAIGQQCRWGPRAGL